MKYHPLTTKIMMVPSKEYYLIDNIICKWLKEKADELDYLPLLHDHSMHQYKQINKILELNQEQTLEEKYFQIYPLIGINEAKKLAQIAKDHYERKNQ